MDISKKHEQLINEANACLSRINHNLDAINKSGFLEESDSDSGSDSGSGSDIQLLRTLQLVLQYRLDSQDALAHIFQFSQSLWQYLGVSKQNSSSLNVERLEFALGGEDLHQALSILSRLIDALLRILQRYHLGRAAQNRAGMTNRRQLEAQHVSPPSPAYLKMVAVVENQKSFNAILEQLKYSLEEAIAGQPSLGPIYDHIGKFEGPISHFHQAVRHGLIAAGSLYQQLEARTQVNLKFDELLRKANQALEQAHQFVEAPKLFKPFKALSASQDLESRAAEKRFGQFFPNPYPHP